MTDGLKGLVAGYGMSVHATAEAAEASMREPRVMDGIERADSGARSAEPPAPVAGTDRLVALMVAQDALIYAANLCEGRLDVEAPFNAAIIRRYVSELRALIGR